VPEIGQVWELYTNFGFFSAAQRLRPTIALTRTGNSQAAPLCGHPQPVMRNITAPFDICYSCNKLKRFNICDIQILATWKTAVS
jgi:hypothetical protein